MYESIRIQNFRGLKDLTIENLGRVNLLVGANNVGKTSVLEAIWLLRGKSFPMRVLELARYRGLDGPSPYGPASTFHGLFYRFALDVPGTIIGFTGGAREERLSISAGGRTTVTMGGSPMFVETPGTELVFDYLADGATETNQIIYDGEGRYAGPVSGHADRAGQLHPAGAQMNAELLASSFTAAERTGQLNIIVDALSATEPRLRGLRLGYSADEKRPTIDALLDGDNVVPLELLGTGSRHLLDMLLSIAQVHDGAFMVDEIENGFYYRVLEPVWRAIGEATRSTSVQLFATTHSWECVEAAVAAFENDSDAFRLHRMERRGDDVVAVTYEHRVALAAVDGLIEVR